MSVLRIGRQFQLKDPWGRQDHYIVDAIQQQIQEKFAGQSNLIVTTTWFGPHFADSAWFEIQDMIQQGRSFDNVFWLATVDPLSVLPTELDRLEQALSCKRSFRMGIGFNTEYEINTGALACLDEFVDYSLQELLPQEFRYVYLAYNRKPKPHRINLVNLLQDNDLQNHGIITLGQPSDHYDVTEGASYRGPLTIEDDADPYTRNGFYNLFKDFGGIPLDLSSLGRLDIWQQHFLNVVGETEFREWDPRFVTEKTWKPIIGLRPFVINGQVKIYQWLRDNGFRTFNQYWPIDIESAVDEQVQPAIVQVIKYLATLSKQDLQRMYDSMLPDLYHNKHRFVEFAKQEKQKLFDIFQGLDQ